MPKSFEHIFTQKSQYTEDTIKTFEATFGSGHMSAGGDETLQKTAELLQPVLSRTSAPTVLDIGCGIGGSAFYFSNCHGAHVTAVDINPIGIQMAKDAMAHRPVQRGSCSFNVVNVTEEEQVEQFTEESFDIIYSRDVLLHLGLAEKLTLFAKCHKWLKPGGMVCLADYCLGPKSAKEISPSFQEYMDTRGYHLLTPEGYAGVFSQSGFDPDFIQASDEGHWYTMVCQREIDRVAVPGPNRDEFLKTKTVADIEKLSKVYGDKISMTLRGDRSYVILCATKVPRYYKARQTVVQAYKTLSEKGWIMSCDGNVSCRAGDDGDVFLVTPSGVVIPDLTADKVVMVSTNGKAVPGEAYKPSSESGLHDSIYRARPDVGAIVHSHSIFVCALACCRLPLPPTHYAVCELLRNLDFSDPKGGSTVPTLENAIVQCAPYHTYGTKALSKVTSESLGQNKAVLMANHGAIVVGTDMEDAMYNTERLERECEIYWRALQMKSVGPTKPLTLDEIRGLQEKDETYGQDHPDPEE